MDWLTKYPVQREEWSYTNLFGPTNPSKQSIQNENNGNYNDDAGDNDIEKNTRNPRVCATKRETVPKDKKVTAFICLPLSYTLMMDCWRKNPDERPSFQELVGRLEQLMLQEVEYFDFNKVDESKDYYQVQESKTAEITGEDKSL